MINVNHSSCVGLPTKPSQHQSSAENSEPDVHDKAVRGSKMAPSGAQAAHVSSPLPTVLNQLELHSEEIYAPNDSQCAPSGAQALLDVSSTPDMRDVNKLVVTAVAANWQSVALALGVKGCVCEAVSKNYPYDCHGACQDMLDRWLKKEHHTGDKERIWCTLFTALRRASYKELERRLRREHFHK